MDLDSPLERRRFLKEGGSAFLSATGLTLAGLASARGEKLPESTQGTIILKSRLGTIARYQAAHDTDASRGEALREAISAGTEGDTIEIIIGRCAVGGIPLSSSLRQKGTGPKIHFGENAAVIYDNADHARQDHALFAGDTRNVLNFGAAPDGTTVSTIAFQAAHNTLPVGLPDLLASGREYRTGILAIPSGGFVIDGTIRISPTVHVRGSGCLGTSGARCTVALKKGSFIDAGKPQFMFDFETVPGFANNNLFSSQFTGVLLCAQPDNPGACGLRMIGAQGCFVDNVFIIDVALVGADLQGISIGTLWIANISRGPGLKWSLGGSAKFLVVEHVNGGGILDPQTSEPYPAISIEGLSGFHIGCISCENAGEGQHYVRINALGVSVDLIMIGTYHLKTDTGVGVRIAGYSQSVNIGCIRGVGDERLSPGTLVKDDSDGSPAGPKKEFLYNTVGGGYSHSAYYELGRKDGNNEWTGRNRFTRHGIRSELGYEVIQSDKDPTTDDIPEGFRQTWSNTTTGEIRDWTNIGGKLFKANLYI